MARYVSRVKRLLLPAAVPHMVRGLAHRPILALSTCLRPRPLYCHQYPATRQYCHTTMTSSRVISVSRGDQGEIVQVKWQGDEESGDEVSRYPSVWLRDNCLCEECFKVSSTSRLFLLKDLDPEVKVTEAKVASSGGVEVCWSDGHSSLFPANWLKQRDFSETACHQRESWHNLPVKLWGAADMQDKIPTENFDKLMNDDEALYRWLVSMESIGLFLLTGAPCQVGTLRMLGDRVAYLRKNNYGEEFTVKAKADPSNLAYTGATLGMHTDLPYFEYSPGMQMLHCIKQVPTKGGENEFVDGFHVAEQLRAEHPEEFRLLTTVPIDYKDVGTDFLKFNMLIRLHVIMLDRDDNVVRIVWNNMMRDSFLNHVPLEKVKPMYRAMKLFHDIMYQPRNLITTKLKPGDIICFHNYRVLHGRAGFEVLSAGERHLEGAYLDWDEMRSRRRVLKEQLKL